MSDVTGQTRRLTCHHCEDVIGVYEVVILETNSGPFETSLTADPWLAESDGTFYHRDCYEPSQNQSG